MRHVIALSVTETGTRAALVGFDGSLVYATRRVRGRAAVDPVARRAEELRALGRERFGAAAEAVGVALPGGAAALPGLQEASLRAALGRRLGRIPVAVAHDVRAAGLAEGRVGAGRGTDRFLFVRLDARVDGAIGTGDGVETGAHGRAGGIGHIVVRPGGPACHCGRRGCLDAVASASAVARGWA
ncbi:ROK family protein, partial [Streptomyces sp. NPDC057540]|uniref:ROK family protein n=1 Tax=Streptomyces sp. NPDC057540 TaxID=3346160 RepID=UPI0036A82A20